MVPDGKTVFLSGLIQHQDNNTREGVPGLGDVPLVGGLFSNRAKSITSTEIVVLITPSIVDYKIEEIETNQVDRVRYINEVMDAEIVDTEQDYNKAFDGEMKQRVKTEK